MERSPEEIYDELLVLRCQDGDEAALAELVDRYQQRLWRHAWRLTGRSDAAADVLQEAWIAIVRGIGRLQDPACFRSWAYRIVTHRAADWSRRVQRQRKLLKNAAAESQLPEENPNENIDQYDVNLLRAALRKLPADRRALLSLFYLDELSIGEIADVLSIPKGTVKSRLFHARNELKTLIERSRT